MDMKERAERLKSEMLLRYQEKSLRIQNEFEAKSLEIERQREHIKASEVR